MAVLHRSAASLRISSENLIPEEISERLGCVPTRQQRKGQVFTSPKSAHTRTARFGLWILEASDQEPEDLNAQVGEILGKLNESLDVWKSIADEHEIDLFCGLFMKRSNEGVEISAQTLAALGQRGIHLGLDIYSPTSEDLEAQRSAALR